MHRTRSHKRAPAHARITTITCTYRKCVCIGNVTPNPEKLQLNIENATIFSFFILFVRLTRRFGRGAERSEGDRDENGARRDGDDDVLLSHSVCKTHRSTHNIPLPRIKKFDISNENAEPNRTHNKSSRVFRLDRARSSIHSEPEHTPARTQTHTYTHIVRNVYILPAIQYIRLVRT